MVILGDEELEEKINTKKTAYEEEIDDLITRHAEKTEEAEVIAVGPGKKLKDGRKSEMPVREGDRVLFKKYGPDEVKLDKEEYLIAGVDDILAIIKDNWT